jgi:hypothetical protein
MNRRILSKNLFIHCLVVLFAVLFLGHSKAGAQNQLIILADPIYVRTPSGHVQDPNTDGVQNARVELYDLQTGKMLASADTDLKGNFHFQSFHKNAYKLKIAMPGFNPLEATLLIRKNAPESAVFTLPIAT